MMFTKKCVVCGQEFITPHSHVVCCTPECKAIRERMLQSQVRFPNKKVYVRICPECGARFCTTVQHRIFCSGFCENKYLAKHEQPGKVMKLTDGLPLIKTCQQCGKQFKARRNIQKYCSVECRNKAVRSTVPDKKPKEIPHETGKKSLEQWAREARMCGMSYGQYRAALAQGKTFEQLVIRR